MVSGCLNVEKTPGTDGFFGNLDFPHGCKYLPQIFPLFDGSRPEAKSELKRRILRALGWGAPADFRTELTN